MTPNLLRILLEEALVEDRDDPYMVPVVSLLEASGSPVASMDTLFEFFEAYPDQVFGLPGALTHYLESFPHELLQTKLFASTERQPAYTTLFMLRRLANGTVGACFETPRNVLAAPPPHRVLPPAACAVPRSRRFALNQALTEEQRPRSRRRAG